MILAFPSRPAQRHSHTFPIRHWLTLVVLLPLLGCHTQTDSQQSAPQKGQPPTSHSTLPTRSPDPHRTSNSSDQDNKAVLEHGPLKNRERSFESQIELVRAGARDSIEIHQTPVSDDQLAQLKSLDNLHVLILNQGSITDEGVSSLTDCPNLTRIRLRNSPITGEGLEKLAQLPHLQWLNLPDAQLDNVALAAVQQMPQLQMLRVGSPAVDDAGIALLRGHPGLRFVHLIEIPVTDRSLDVFGSLPHLESLYLDGAEVTDEGWTAWFASHRDVHVHLDQAHHDRDPAKH